MIASSEMAVQIRCLVVRATTLSKETVATISSTVNGTTTRSRAGLEMILSWVMMAMTL